MAPGTTLTLSATSEDVEDGDLGASILWRSSQDGQIGSGGTITAVLSLGTHTVTASVTDSGGAERSRQITVTVTSPIAYTSPPSHIAAGNGHTCALDAAGHALCWGANDGGQLGDFTTTERPNPDVISSSSTFTRIESGFRDTCAVTAAGQAYCWGYLEPGDYPAPVTGGHTFAQVSPGFEHVCGIDTSQDAYCWGVGYQGELGGGSPPSSETMPAAVSGGLSFLHVDAGANATCGITDVGSAYCWGSNFDYLLGTTATTEICLQSDPCSTVPIAVTGDLTFLQIDVGLGHACGVDQVGQAYCWGRGPTGEQGDGSLSDHEAPVAVWGGHAFTQVVVGATHTCAMEASGKAYCWGSNADGQLGDGNIGNGKTTPVSVVGEHTFTQLSSGGDHTCGEETSGAYYCWGRNDHGQLGDGTTEDSATPVEVAMP